MSAIHQEWRSPFFALNNAGPGTYTSADQANYQDRGLKIYVTPSGIVGGATLTITIQGKDPISGNYFTVLTSAALSANNVTTVLTVYPSVTAATNVAVSDVLPTIWRISAAVGGAGSLSATFGGARLQ